MWIETGLGEAINLDRVTSFTVRRVEGKEVQLRAMIDSKLVVYHLGVLRDGVSFDVERAIFKGLSNGTSVLSIHDIIK